MQQVVPQQPPAGYNPGPAWNTTPIITPTAPASGFYPAGPACQPCPDCGGLDCLCRPRFFAGQLLTEQDLNRLDQYIVAKNRLHNRYLVGTGVVCGLEVTCSPCDNTISVAPGYAIDTCGNDIIVCSPDTVDICALIKACTPSARVNCGPYKDASTCKDVEQDWILAISYQETPSRGITPLTGASKCACGSAGSCSCGGGAAKPCGCGSMKPAGSCCGQTVGHASPFAAKRPRRGAPTACEPTVTCEAYRYEVFPAPQAPAKPTGDSVLGIGGLAGAIGGDMFARIAACVQGLIAVVPNFPTGAPAANKVGWSNFCCNLRQALIQYVVGQSGTDCQALRKLHAVSCPSPNLGDAAFVYELGAAFEAELLIVVEMMVDCVCSAALPPCPAPGDPRVPLACVRVRSSDCMVVSICDWTPLRKNVVTNRTLGYWLGWLPFVPMLRQLMQQMCCNLFGLSDQLGTGTVHGYYHAEEHIVQANSASDTGTASADSIPRADDKSTGTPEDTATAFDKPITFGARSYQASNPISQAIVTNLAGATNALSVADLAHALFDPIDPGTSGDTGAAARLAATPHAKVLAEMARPLLSSLGPLLQAATGSQPKPASANDLAAMRTDLDTLRGTVAAQQTALDAMRQAAAPTPPTPPGKP